jgi:hypothetical protein
MNQLTAHAIFCSLVSLSVNASAQTSGWTPSLRADDSPASKPWDEGASLAVNTVNGNTSVIADAVLSLEKINHVANDQGFSRTYFGPGLYLHRNSDSAKPTNDRGVSFKGGGFFVNAGSAGGPRTSWGWNAEARFGQKQITENANGLTTQFDKNNSRFTLGGEYVYAPAVSGVPTPGVAKAFWFVTGAARVYVDRLTGGSGPQGQLSGTELSARVDVAPWGINPENLKVGGTGLGVVPSIGIFARFQNDLGATGDRVRDHRSLYGIKLNLGFSQLDSNGPVPGLSLERSVGSDILTGRPESGITKLLLTLKY